MDNVSFESLTYHISLHQDTNFRGFNSAPRNYFIPKINMRLFDGNYPLTWIFRKENFFEIMVKQLGNRGITEYLVKWRNIRVEYSTWEDEFFIQNHLQLLMR